MKLNSSSIFLLQVQSFRGVPPFKVELNGFDRFPSSRVIYLHVEDSPDLDKLRAPFNYIREGFKPKKYFHVLNNKPHVTIARGLRQDIFEEAEKDYLSRIYVSSFLVDKLNMLRREVNEDGRHGRYEHVCYLTLGEER